MEAFHSCIEKVIVLPIDYHLGLNKNVASLFAVLIIHYSRLFNATSIFLAYCKGVQRKSKLHKRHLTTYLFWILATFQAKNYKDENPLRKIHSS